MHAKTLSRKFRQRSAPLWDAIMTHPFVRGIGSGRLSRARFAFYLEQDYYYLAEFSRVLALAAAKSTATSDMRHVADLLHDTLAVEMDLHRRTCAEFGMDLKALEKTEPAFVTLAYTNMLVRTCYEGGIADIFAALLPCEAGYAEIAETLRRRSLPKNRHYRDWIETYSSPEFRGVADWVAGMFDEHSKDGAPRDVERWRKLYLASARLELLFFEMSWRRESWPAAVARASAAGQRRRGR